MENVVIEVLGLEHGQKVEKYWMQITDKAKRYDFDLIGAYYGFIDNYFGCFPKSTVERINAKIITLPE